MRLPTFALASVLLACGSTSTTDPGSAGTDAAVVADALAPSQDGGSGVDASNVPDASGCAVPVSAGTQKVTCAGIPLTITAPASCTTQACGIIMDVHGLGMDADAEDANTNLRALGTAAGYVVVQPTAPGSTAYGPTWFDGDDAAIWASFSAVVSAWKVDPKRIHVTGFSQGGYVTWRMICAHSDVIASAAPGAAGSANCPVGNFNGTCSFQGSDKPAMPIDVLFVAGWKDAIVPAACTSAQVDAVAAAWGGQKQIIGGDVTYTRDRYDGTSGNVFEVLSHAYTTDPLGPLAANQGHCIPGASAHTGTVWDSIGCKAPNSFVWGQEVLAFFQAHPKK